MARKIREFFFKNKTKEEMVEYVNQQHEIYLKGMNELIDRIHNQYPLIDKVDVIIIVKALLESIRDLMILGETLNIQEIFSEMKLNFITKKRSGIVWPGVHVVLLTPMRLSGKKVYEKYLKP